MLQLRLHAATNTSFLKGRNEATEGVNRNIQETKKKARLPLWSSSPSPTLTSAHHWSVLRPFSLTVSKMSYKGNVNVYNLLRLASFTSIIPLRFIHNSAFYQYSAPFYCWKEYTTVYPFAYWRTSERFPKFLVIIISAAINTYIQVCMWMYVFISLGNISKRRTAGHHTFNFIKNKKNC